MNTMPVWFKIIWLVVILLSTASLIWWVMGSTGGLQRGHDLIGTVVLVTFVIPSVVIILVSLTFIWNGWAPFSGRKYFISFLLMALLLFFSYQVFNATSTTGWLEDDVRSDPVRLTADQKYEYRIDLINPFQRNSREQLHLKEVSSGKEMDIPIVLRKDRQPYFNGSGDDWAWAILMPTESPYQYKLSTLEQDQVEDYNLDRRVYLINAQAGTARLLE